MVSNDEVRFQILQKTYEVYHENPTGLGIDRNSMEKILRVPPNIMDANILYRRKRIDKTSKVFGCPVGCSWDNSFWD